MKTLWLIGALSAATLGACITTGEGPGGGNVSGPGECQGEPGQSFVGQRATTEVGARLLRATGARQLRWVPPHTGVTMDFRPDRLTVSYDDNYNIERVSCG